MTARLMILSALGAAALAACLCAAPAAAAESASAAFVGKPAPDFTLPDAAGAKQPLSGLRGSRGTVLLWISTQCPVSNAYNARIAALAKTYEPQGFRFVGINSNKEEKAPDIARHAAENGFAFTILKDEGNVVADAYGASVTPEAYVLDAQGILIYHGRIDDSQKEAAVTSRDLEAALGAVLGGRPVEKAESKAFGCTIKRVARAGA